MRVRSSWLSASSPLPIWLFGQRRFFSGLQPTVFCEGRSCRCRDDSAPSVLRPNALPVAARWRALSLTAGQQLIGQTSGSLRPEITTDANWPSGAHRGERLRRSQARSPAIVVDPVRGIGGELELSCFGA